MPSMHSQRSAYRSSSSLSPTTIGAVIVVHLALGAAIMSMTAFEAIQKQVDIIWARNIPAEQPKAEPVKPRPEAQKPRHEETVLVQPRIDLGSLQQDAVKLDPLPTDDFLRDRGPVIEPGKLPEKPAPIMVDARPDTRFMEAFQPPYPAAMLRLQMEGKVTVRVTIGPDGRVQDITLVNAPDPAFFEATRRQALSRWRFTPATRDGVPVVSEKVMTVTFRLTE